MHMPRLRCRVCETSTTSLIFYLAPLAILRCPSVPSRHCLEMRIISYTQMRQAIPTQPFPILSNVAQISASRSSKEESKSDISPKLKVEKQIQVLTSYAPAHH
jgi:hypothetical protein